jgi:hypothetical protein
MKSAGFSRAFLLRLSMAEASAPHPDERGTRVSKDEGPAVASPFETRADGALLRARVESPRAFYSPCYMILEWFWIPPAWSASAS